MEQFKDFAKYFENALEEEELILIEKTNLTRLYRSLNTYFYISYIKNNYYIGVYIKQSDITMQRHIWNITTRDRPNKIVRYFLSSI